MKLMKRPPLIPAIWPDCPDRFDDHGLALLLLTLPEGQHRSAARQFARVALTRVALSITGKPVELVESPVGPQLAGSDIRVSLSYAGDRVLIGLSEFRDLGVDIVRVENLPERGMLSRLYLPESAQPDAPYDESFALAWAKMEGCCKALRLPLAEIDAEREQAYAACRLFDCVQISGYRIAVAVRQAR